MIDVRMFTVGPLQENAGLSLSTLYGWAAFVALALGGLAFVIVRRGAQPVEDTQAAVT